MRNPITYRVSEWIAETSFEDLPAEVRRQARRALQDAIACAIGGQRTPIVQSVVRALQKQGLGASGTLLIGSSARMPEALAAFVNAVAINALDFDDTFEIGSNPLGHPGSTTIGAAMAVGNGWSGRELLCAVALGLELSIRVALAVQPSPQRRDLVWGTGLHQVFGAAAAVSRRLRLDASRIQEALGLAGTQTSVPSVWGAAGWIKDGVAWPAFTGVLAAFLADAGFKGPSRIFDGRRSYFAMAGSDRYEPETLVADLGERWNLLQLSFKPYPACRWIHAILDALVTIRDREGLRPDDVQEVIVTGTWELERIFARYEPMDLVDAQFSLPYLCALILHRVAPGTDWFDAELLTNREVLALARRVNIKTDPSAEIARQRNPNEMNATLSIILTDSRHLTMKCLRARGGPSAPLSDAELDVKFLQLTRSILGDQKASTALDMIHHIDDVDNVGDLLSTLISEHMSMEYAWR